MAGAVTLGNVASAIGANAEEASIVAELKSGSEDAYDWLVARYHQPIYSLVYRILTDPSDAADTTQEVFLKVFRGMKRFNGQCSLKTWLYRIAIHEASNQRRWWFRHKSKETSMEAHHDDDGYSTGLCQTLADPGESPLETFAHEEIRARVEQELQQVAEPYRTTVVLRDIEGLSYEEIAEVLQISLGTVKSRLIRGRDALRKRLEPFVRQMSLDGKDGASPGAPEPMYEQRVPGQHLLDQCVPAPSMAARPANMDVKWRRSHEM
jgi:RNA polymerase sigma-70 factor (ECF subfamily)